MWRAQKVVSYGEHSERICEKLNLGNIAQYYHEVFIAIYQKASVSDYSIPEASLSLIQKPLAPQGDKVYLVLR